MISQTVEYSLRAVVVLAQHFGRPCTARQISEVTRVPGPYLSKLMQGMVRAGLVRSQRGLHGGFVLIRDPDQLTIWDVVEAVEPIKRIRSCPLEIQGHGPNLCPLHRRLDDALALVERSFRDTMLSELLDQEGASTPLCRTEPVVQIGDLLAPDATDRPQGNVEPEKKEGIG